MFVDNIYLHDETQHRSPGAPNYLLKHHSPFDCYCVLADMGSTDTHALFGESIHYSVFHRCHETSRNVREIK